MGVRHGDTVRLTIACAMIGQYLTGMMIILPEDRDPEDSDELAQHGFTATHAAVNAADDPSALTVTGTSGAAMRDVCAAALAQ